MIFAFASSTTIFVTIFLTSFVVSLFGIFANSYNKNQQEKHRHDSRKEDADEDEEEAEKAKLLVDAALLGLAMHKTSKRKKSKKDNWETHCEFCGELLEDCQCDHQHESRRDLGLWDFDDDDD